MYLRSVTMDGLVAWEIPVKPPRLVAVQRGKEPRDTTYAISFQGPTGETFQLLLNGMAELDDVRQRLWKTEK